MRRYLAVAGLAVLVACGGTSAPASTASAVCAAWAKLDADVNSRRVTDGVAIYGRLIGLSKAATAAAQSNPGAAPLADAASTMMRDYRSGTPTQLTADRSAMDAQCAGVTP